MMRACWSGSTDEEGCLACGRIDLEDGLGDLVLVSGVLDYVDGVLGQLVPLVSSCIPTTFV
jgi:hypothetical protein